MLLCFHHLLACALDYDELAEYGQTSRDSKEGGYDVVVMWSSREPDDQHETMDCARARASFDPPWYAPWPSQPLPSAQYHCHSAQSIQV